MKDINIVRVSGMIFWSKLDDRQTFSMLRLGINVDEGGSIFLTVNNPKVKAYNIVKSGNKILVSNAWLDTWNKKDGSEELQLKCYSNGVSFFEAEKAFAGVNEATILGTIKNYQGNNTKIEMIGDRNPKTNKYALRTATVNIGDSYSQEIVGNKVFLRGKVTSIEDENRRSKLVVNASYDTINIL